MGGGMRVEKVKLSKIKPNPDNPRLIKNDQFKRLCKSLQDFPEMLSLREIVVDEEYVGRKCYGMELDNAYVDVIINRWCQFTGNYSIYRNGEKYEWEAK